MKKVLCTLFFLLSVGFCDIRLKDQLAVAQPGSYLVTEQNKTFTFLHIHDCNNRSIVIEEVTIPAARFARNPMNWKQWFECGAPGHTAWTMSMINLETGCFEETFSFTHHGWIDMSETNPFLSQLLNLCFHPVPESHRRRIGLPPGHGKADRRPIWNPRLVVDGMKLGYVPFSAWKTRWPADGSELSRKTIEIYLPTEILDPSMPHYPIFFPYWIEVEGKIGSAKVRVIDSGMHALSPKESLPLRSPELLGEGEFNPEGNLTIYLKSPSYHSKFLLLAEGEFGHLFPLPCETASFENQVVSLTVSKEELAKVLTEGESYTFMISSNSMTIETRKPLLYKQI